VPESFSAYRPRGGFWGEFAPMGNAPSMASDLGQAFSVKKSFEGKRKHLLMVRIKAISVSVLFRVAKLCNRHSQCRDWFRPCEL
jgi:hypothetical protein